MSWQLTQLRQMGIERTEVVGRKENTKVELHWMERKFLA